MKELISLKDLDTNDFVIKWRITQWCNINCSYCIRHNNLSFDKKNIETSEEELSEAAKKISSLIDRTPFNNVKIDLIGGEVSIFDLKKILSNIKTEKLKRINITTNLIKSADYYIELAKFLNSKKIELTLTASFHFEFQTMESYFDKVNKIVPYCKLFTCEMVSTDNNKEKCLIFVEKCKQINVDYMVETDLRIEKSGERISNQYLNIVNKKNKNPRYLATFNDKTKKVYSSRNNFLCDKEINSNVLQKMIETKGFYCTNSWNYIYIDYNFIRGKSDTFSDCRQIIQIDDFNIVKPSKCQENACTLCGHMSIYKNKKDIDNDCV